MAAATGISKITVDRCLQTFSVQPHRQWSFELSTDPFFAEMVCDIAGLYLNMLDKAMMIRVEEKTQIQALKQTKPLLPMNQGDLQSVKYDHIRNSTTSLFFS